MNIDPAASTSPKPYPSWNPQVQQVRQDFTTVMTDLSEKQGRLAAYSNNDTPVGDGWETSLSSTAQLLGNTTVAFSSLFPRATAVSTQLVGATVDVAAKAGRLGAYYMDGTQLGDWTTALQGPINAVQSALTVLNQGTQAG